MIEVATAWLDSYKDAFDALAGERIAALARRRRGLTPRMTGRSFCPMP